MLTRFALTGFGVLTLLGSLLAQLPPTNPNPPTRPPFGAPPTPPGRLPPSLLPPPTQPGQTQEPTGGLPAPDESVRLPHRENLTPIDPLTLSVRYHDDTWQLFAGHAPLADFGRRQSDAEEARRIMRELRPTEWGRIGSPRPVLEYGLQQGKAGPWPSVKSSIGIELMSVRAEQIRGAWCLRDDAELLINFGTSRADAEQAAAVCKRYGFNRIALVGAPQPVFAVLYAAPVLAAGGANSTATLSRIAAEQNMARTGIPVPGLGFVGERLVIDPRKVEVRKDRGEYVLAHGPDVLARFGQSDWAARDGLKVIRDCRFTEFCRYGEVTFFLINGTAPTRVPFSVQGTHFDANLLKAKPFDSRWGVFDSVGRFLFPATSQEEAEKLIRVLQAFGFDQVCQVGLSPRSGLKFLAKTGR